MKTLHNPVIIGLISSVIIGGVIFIMFQTIISGPLTLPSHNWNATTVTPDLKGLNSTEMTLKNQTYYFDTLNDTITAYHNDPVQILFHEVVFTLFPSPYSVGPPGSCGGNNFGADTKFQDGVHESLNIFVQSQPCLGASTPTHISNHTHPQSGLIFYNGTMKLLVSTNVLDSAKKRPCVGTARVLSHSSPVQLLDMYGNDSSSISSANQLSGLSAKIPAYVPSALELKTIKSGDSHMVTLFYLPKQLSLDPRTTLDDVLACNGLIIVNTKEPPLDRAKWIQDNIAAGDGANEITIHGQKAIGSNGVPQNGMESTVIFYDGNTKVILFSTGYSESELIKIAESLHKLPESNATTLKAGNTEIYITAVSQEAENQFNPQELSNVQGKAITLNDSALSSLPKLKDGLINALKSSMSNIEEAGKNYVITVSPAELSAIISTIGSANISHDSFNRDKDFGTGTDIIIDRSSAIVKYGDNYYYLIINTISPT